MNDRELLELAAKAAGTIYVDGESWDEEAGWNPLTDDGDALRLAVALGMVIDTSWTVALTRVTPTLTFLNQSMVIRRGAEKLTVMPPPAAPSYVQRQK